MRREQTLLTWLSERNNFFSLNYAFWNIKFPKNTGFFLLGDEVQQGQELQVEVRACTAQILLQCLQEDLSPISGHKLCTSDCTRASAHAACPALGSKGPQRAAFPWRGFGILLVAALSLLTRSRSVWGGFPCAPGPFLLLQHGQDAVASARRLLPRGLVLSDLWCAGGGKTQILSLW